MQEIKWLEMTLSVILSSFGGIVKRLVEIENNPKRKFRPAMYIISALISLFVGVFIYAGCQVGSLDFWTTIMVTTGGGFLGTPLIYIGFNWITRKHISNFEIIERDGGEK